MQPTYRTHPLTPAQQRAFQRLAQEAQLILAKAQAQAESLMQGYMKGIGVEYGLEDGQWSLSPDGTMLMHFNPSQQQDPPPPPILTPPQPAATPEMSHPRRTNGGAGKP